MLKPLSDRIIVKLLEEKEIKGKLWLPDDAKSTLAYGEVLAVGPGRMGADEKRTPMTLKVGNKVVYRPNASDFAILDGKEILTMYEGDIIGTI